MLRRDWLTYAFAAALTGGCKKVESKHTPEDAAKLRKEWEERGRIHLQKALAAFPFKVVQTTGLEALSTWERLKASNQGSPVVVGEEREFNHVVEQCSGHVFSVGRQTSAELLSLAARIDYPKEFMAKVARDEAEAHAQLVATLKRDPNTPLPSIRVMESGGGSHQLSREEVIAEFLKEPREPELGVWPTAAPDDLDLGPSVAYGSGKPHEKVYIVLVPTNDWTEIPAHLHWGNWNACPSPEYHVAALRSWRDRYGAELVGLSSDVMNLRVTRPPQTREDALALAREHYAYCNDLIDQGVETLSALAADRMYKRWWYFWWD